jgi:hypothetical protein
MCDCSRRRPVARRLDTRRLGATYRDTLYLVDLCFDTYRLEEIYLDTLRLEGKYPGTCCPGAKCRSTSRRSPYALTFIVRKGGLRFDTRYAEG